MSSASYRSLTDEEPVRTRALRPTRVILALFGGAVYGYNCSAGAVLEDVRLRFGLDSFGEELVSASATLTDALTMLLVGWVLLDRIGRERVFLVGGLASVAAAVLAGSVVSFGQLVASRFVAGVGNGVYLLTVPLMLSEGSEAGGRRGRLITLFQTGVVLGFACPYAVQLAFGEWRVTLALGGVPALVAMCAFVWGRCYAVEHASFWDDRVRQRCEQTPDSSTSETAAAASSGLLICDFRICLAIMLAFVNNSSDPIVFYGPKMVAITGLGSEDSLATALALALVSLPAMAIVWALITRLSRRVLYLLGLGVVIASYALLGTLFVLFDGGANTPATKALSVCAFVILMLGYQLGPGTLFLTILPELFESPEDRARGTSCGTAAMSAISVACNGSLLSTIDAIGAGATFFAYGAAYVLCFGVLLRSLPETGKRVLRRVNTSGDVHDSERQM